MADANQVRVLHLLVKHTGSRNPVSRRTQQRITLPKEEAHEILRNYHTELSKLTGEPLLVAFARASGNRSDCSSYRKLGDLGNFGRGQMQRPFEEASFALNEYEMTDIVDTDSGSHLILRIPSRLNLQEAMQIRVLHLLAKHTGSRNPISRRTNKQITIPKKEAQNIINEYVNKYQTLEGDDLVKAFVQDARERSDCGSFRNGGDLGLFGVGQMQKPFEDASYALDEFGVSGVVDSDSGTHVILRIPKNYRL